MGFDHNNNKHAGQDSMWTSYSDLFLGLSIIFLLLYVTSSLKQGTDGISKTKELQDLAKEAASLKSQMAAYESIKQNYLKKEASNDEQASYEELMSKLDLLQDEQTQEKNKLMEKAKENEKKAVALNKYQQMIRNIINSNLVAKSRIKNRDTMIDEKEEVIEQKTEEIGSLEQTVAQKTAAIARNEEQINGMKSALDTRVKQLRNAYTAHKISKEKFEQAQAQARKDAEAKIRAVAAAKAKTERELAQASEELAATSSKLSETEQRANQLGQEKEKLAGALASADGKHKATVNQLKGEAEAQRARAQADLEAQEAKAKSDLAAAQARSAAALAAADAKAKAAIADADGKYKAEMDRLKGEADAAKGREKAAFEAALAKEKLSGAERAAREAKFKADADKKAGELAGRLADLDKKYKNTQGELARAQENLNARKKLASQIKSNFAKQGVKAEVDEGTGDVLLSFGDEYFGSGEASLKPKMRKILEQAMPAYSSSLFENDKIAQKINSVEIVGFASPTYKGKYVDPTSLDQKDREAVNYNLDLSYGRARSIFNYVFDKDKMAFKHQQRLLPLVKVTGRSFLTSDKTRDPATAGGGQEGFCKVNDCAKLQKVIIKFTLKD